MTSQIALRTLDAQAAAFADASERIEGGRRLAAAEIATLTALAHSVDAATRTWSGLYAQLDTARDVDVSGRCAQARMDAALAGVLVLEAVFDALLTPEAWRVLSAALAVAAEA
jgi:hypothetical protein